MAWSKNHGKVAKVNADYAKEQGDYAQTEANKVEQFIEDNKTKWLPAVATVAARNSAYPNPEHGDTVRVTSEAKTYRYVSPTGWVVTDIYDASAIDQLAQQLAQTVDNFYYLEREKLQSETDFTPALERLMEKMKGVGGTIILPSKEIPLSKSLKVSESHITIKGSRGASKLKFSASDDGNGVVIGSADKQVVGINFDGFEMEDATGKTLTALKFNPSGLGSYSAVDISFNNIRINEFKTWISSTYSWCVNFSNCRFRNGTEGLIFGSQSNLFTFNSCSFSGASSYFISATNSELVNFNECNIVHSPTLITKCLQSLLNFRTCYFEFITSFGNFGESGEVIPSVLNIYGGQIIKSGTPEQEVIDLILMGDVNNLAHHINIEGNVRVADIKIQQRDNRYVKNYVKRGNIQVMSRLDMYKPKKIIEWYGGEAIPFTHTHNAFKNVENFNGYSRVITSPATNGILITSATVRPLIQDEYYTLVMALRSDRQDLLSIRHKFDGTKCHAVKLDESFDIVYYPFKATDDPKLYLMMLTSTGTVSNDISLDVAYIGLYKGTCFPKIPIRT